MSEAAKQRYVFGPVPSRRLGRSLGVDIVPRKVCTMDCVYCQVGRTTRITLERGSFVPIGDVLAEIRAKLDKGPRPDHITISGSGEPTLNSDIGALIDGIKAMTDVPVAIMTNGSLLYDPAARRDCAKADVVLPSLDAADEEGFQRVNRPAQGLTFEMLVRGMEEFRTEYKKPIWLEVFLIRGVNTGGEQLEKMRKIIERIRPDRVQLNTAVRPTADAGVTALTEAELEAAAAKLGPKAEVIADFKRESDKASFTAAEGEILDMIRRRPVTLADIAAGLGVKQGEAAQVVARLISKRLIIKEAREGNEFFRAC